MRYRNYGKTNNNFGSFFSNELYKGLNQNKRLPIVEKPVNTELSLHKSDNNKHESQHNSKAKRSIILFFFVVILCISLPFLVSSFQKHRIVSQIENISQQNGLKNVVVIYIEKDKQHDWYNVIIECSNFSDFAFDDMVNITSKIEQIDKVMVESVISNDKKYFVFSDAIYINGVEYTLKKESKEEPESSYRCWQGMNGTWTYRCERECNESCKNCRSCIQGRENFGGECTFEYSSNSQIGWIGCPLCGDVDNEYWQKWYKSTQ